MRRRALAVGGLVAVAAATVCTTAALGTGVTPGEVYRVWLDGRRIDLSRSKGDDTFPVVSPDGRRVALVEDAYLYLVGSDGRGREKQSSGLPTNQSFVNQIAWSPDSTRLVIAASYDPTSLYLIGRGRRQRVIANAQSISEPAWSPDGRLIAFRTGTVRQNQVWAVGASGRQAWRVPGSRFSWSRAGRVAVQVHGHGGRPETVRVYDERGRPLAAFPGRSFAWSLSGDRLASVFVNRLDVHRADGRLLFRRAVPGLRAGGRNWLVWLGTNRLVIGNVESPNHSVGQIGLDLRTGSTWLANSRFFGNLSPDRSLVASVVNLRRGFGLRVSRVDGSEARMLVRREPCPDLVEADVQWSPDGRSLVYDFRCEPKRP